MPRCKTWQSGTASASAPQLLPDHAGDDIGDPKLTREFASPKVIKALQDSSDLELKKSLDVINNYDPDWFNG